MSYNLLDRDEIITIAEDRRKEIEEQRDVIEEQRNTIKELEETVRVLENSNLDMYKELEKLRCYQHAMNALMFLYKFCKGEVDNEQKAQESNKT
jgi:predicted RNase H-like nuclease (RuvC/YqgF family)